MFKKVLCGFTIVILGILLFLGNFDVIDFSLTISKIWPVLIAVFAIGNMLDNKKIDAGSIILLILGFYFILRNYGYINISFTQAIIPVLLIIIGLAIMLPKQVEKVDEDRDNNLKNIKNDIMLNAVLGGAESKRESKELKKVEMTSVLGSCTLNLTNSETKNGICKCYASIILGGADIILPDDWTVNVDGLTCILGGVDDSRSDSQKKAKNVLYLSGTVILGGIDIK